MSSYPLNYIYWEYLSWHVPSLKQRAKSVEKIITTLSSIFNKINVNFSMAGKTAMVGSSICVQIRQEHRVGLPKYLRFPGVAGHAKWITAVGDDTAVTVHSSSLCLVIFVTLWHIININYNTENVYVVTRNQTFNCFVQIHKRWLRQ